MKSINLIADPSEVQITGEVIPNLAAIRMIKLFQLDNEGNPKKTFAVHFDLSDWDHIKDLLTKTNANGFAFFYSKYPSDGSLNPTGKNYGERQTIVLVPTINRKPVPGIDLNAPTLPAAGGESAYNHGQLEP